MSEVFQRLPEVIGSASAVHSTKRTAEVIPEGARSGGREKERQRFAEVISGDVKGSPLTDTFKAQILTRIEKALKPATLSISDYKITFMVPCIQKMTDLDDEESYCFMVGRAVCSGDPSAVICIEPLIPEDVSYASAFFSFILMIMFRNPVLIRKTKTVAVAVRAGVM
jgi:hypothetical protein